MKKIFIILLVNFMIVAFLVGCQATPEKPVVIQKDLEQMMEKGMEESDSVTPAPETSEIDYSELCEYYGVPERFQKDINEQGVEIHADIAIELPETMQLPMVKVEADKFSQEQVYALFNALCGDTPMYIVPLVWDRAYYEQQILEYQAQLAADKTDKVYADFVNGIIDDLKEQHESAPETLELIPSDGTLQTMEVKYENTDAASGAQTYLEANADPRGLPTMYSANTMPTFTQFTVYNDIDYDNTDVYSYVDERGNTQNFAPSSGSSVAFQRDMSLCRYGLKGTKLADMTALSLSGGAADDCLLETTPQQARKTVEQLMAETGMDDMVIDRVSLYSSKEEPLPPDFLEELEKEGIDTSKLLNKSPETQAYLYRLLRRANGVKVESDHDSSMTNMDGVSYGKEWMYEMMTIAVDDEGIANLYWTGPLKVIEIMTENTTMLPWDDIESVFEKMLVIQNIDYLEHSPDVSIDVTHASLSLQRIMERDSFTSGLLVPVWNFYGTTTLTNDKGTAYVIDNVYFPLLSINAVDGTVIDTDKGY